MELRNLFRRKRTKFDTKRETANIVESIAKCKTLYKELIVKAHPDRNPDKIALAEEITKSVNDNRCNYAKLVELKSRIENEL